MVLILASLLTRSCVMLMLTLIDGGHLSQFIDPFLRHVDADINRWGHLSQFIDPFLRHVDADINRWWSS